MRGVAGAVAGGLIGRALPKASIPASKSIIGEATIAPAPMFSRAPGMTNMLPPTSTAGNPMAATRAGSSMRSRATWVETRDRVKGKSQLKWDQAKQATRDAWDRVTSERRVD